MTQAHGGSPPWAFFGAHIAGDAGPRLSSIRKPRQARLAPASGRSPIVAFLFWDAPDGSVMDQQRRVTVQGGERRTVDFLTPAPSASGAVAGN